MPEYLSFACDSAIKDTQVYLIEADDPEQAREAIKHNYNVQGWPTTDLGTIAVVRIIRSRTRHEYKNTGILLLGKASQLLSRQEKPFDGDPRYEHVIAYLNETATDLVYLGARDRDEHTVEFSTVRRGTGAPFTFTLPVTIVHQLAQSVA